MPSILFPLQKASPSNANAKCFVPLLLIMPSFLFIAHANDILPGILPSVSVVQWFLPKTGADRKASNALNDFINLSWGSRSSTKCRIPFNEPFTVK